MPYNRKVFFDEIRKSVFMGALTSKAVVSCEAILDEWEARKLTNEWWLAYMFSTVRGECGLNMAPVREGFSSSDDAARKFVARQGYKYAKVVNGQVYYGRGLVQLTWDFNYRAMSDILGMDLLNNPDRALHPTVAVKIMFEGMIRGTFTTKKLSDYLDGPNPDLLSARRIINGTDKAAQFAAWARQFHAALVKARLAGGSLPAPAPKPAPKPAPAPQAPASAPVPAKKTGWLEAILNFFKRKA
jgi:hypothetical protein